MLDAAALLRVTEGFFGATLGHLTWESALARVGDAVGADHVILTATTPGPFAVADRLNQSEVFRLVAMHGQFESDAASTRGVARGQAVTGSSLMPDSQYRRTAHYNEVIRPIGGRYAIFGKATAAADGSAIVICRGERGGDFETGDADAVTALMPHLSLALALCARGEPSSRPVDGDSLLEAFGGAALICDGSARVLQSNGAARTLLEASDGIAVSAGRLAAMNSSETPRLREAVARVASGDGGVVSPPTRVRVVRRSGRVPLSLRLVATARLGAAAGDPRAVAIFVSEPDAGPAVDRAVLAEVFRLAPRESEIACLLVAGRPVSQIAAITGLRTGSVRTYLKRIYDKTDARSQAALVALLRGLA